MILAKYGRVFKRPSADLRRGVDWIFRDGERENLIGIANEGSTSRRWRKNSSLLQPASCRVSANAGQSVEGSVVVDRLGQLYHGGRQP